VRTGQVMSDQVSTCQVRSGQIKSDQAQVMLDEGQMSSRQVKIKVGVDHVKPRSDQVRLRQGQVKVR